MDNTLIATIILGAVGIGITAYYSRQNKKIADEQMLKQLFTEFNLRYDALNNYLFKIEQEFPTIDLLDQAENSSELKQKVIDYFSLCAEEFYWYHHKKRIDILIWKSWQSGMNYWYNEVPAIKALWEEEVKSNGKESYYITNHVEFFIDSKNRSKV
jgi:hypothetical protein